MKGRFQIQRRIREKCRVWRSAVLAAVLWWAVLSGIFVLEGCGRTEDEAEPALEQEAAEADIRTRRNRAAAQIRLFPPAPTRQWYGRAGNIHTMTI